MNKFPPVLVSQDDGKVAALNGPEPAEADLSSRAAAFRGIWNRNKPGARFAGKRLMRVNHGQLQSS